MRLLNFTWLMCGVARATTSCTTSPTTPPTIVESSPNPIGTLYPTSVTGTNNGTIAVVPIPYDLARTLIPSKYRILKEAYKSLLPEFPADKYPLIIRSILDHDVGVNGVALIPDFQSIHFSYPFVDLLGDGYSNFAYTKYLIATATNEFAISGAEGYGQTAIPAKFEPVNNSYAFSPKGRESGAIFLNAYTESSSHPIVTTNFKPLRTVGRWPVEFYVNVTNQPMFGDGVKCNQQINFFNTTLSQGANAPVDIIGDITVSAPYLLSNSIFKDVHGLKVDVAFLENNNLTCSTLKGM